MCETGRKETVKEIEMHNFLVCACKSQDFAQNQKNFARLQDRETVTFGNSVLIIIRQKVSVSHRSVSREGQKQTTPPPSPQKIQTTFPKKKSFKKLGIWSCTRSIYYTVFEKSGT